MASLSGSKQVRFGRIFRAPFEYNKGFSNGDGNKNKLSFNTSYEDPTYLSFKVEFGGWGRSQESLISNNTYIDDAEFNNVWDSNFDDYPMGLFDTNFKEPTDSYYDQTDTYGTVNRYNAVNWLYTRHEDARAEYLRDFIDGITNLQTYSPYFITSVSGIDDLLDFDINRGRRVKKDANISFTFNDSIDQRVRTLFELYRKAAWDDEYQRWILPENLREFKMIIYISEIRNFHRPNNELKKKEEEDNKKKLTILDNIPNLYSNWLTDNEKETNSEGKQYLMKAIEYDGNDIAPVYAFECYPCEFVIGPLFNNEYKSYREGDDEQIKVSVKVKNVRTYMKNKIIDKINDVIISDQLSIYRRYFGHTLGGDRINLEIEAPYKSWLRRDFFTNLYNETGGDPSSFLITSGTSGVIENGSKIEVHNEELFKDLNEAADFGSLLAANIKRLFGVTGDQFLLKNFSLTEFVEKYILDALYDNLKKMQLLNGGLNMESELSQRMMFDMMDNWHRALSRFKLDDSEYLSDIENGINMLMDKLEHNQDLLENFYQGTINLHARLNEYRTALLHGAKLEGDDPLLEFIETYLIPTDPSVDFQDMPLDDASVDLNFVKTELDDTQPKLQFVETQLEDIDLDLNFQDAPLDNPSLNLQFVDAQLDLTSPDLIFAAAQLEEPELNLKFQDAPLEDNELNLKFQDAPLEDNPVNLKFQGAKLEGVENPLKFQSADLEGVENPLKFQGAKLEGVDNPLKFQGADLEGVENPLKFQGADLEGVENPMKFQGAKLEGVKNPLKFQGAKLQGVENPLKFQGANLEETENSMKFQGADLEGVENNVKLKSANLEEVENKVKFNDIKLEEVDNEVKFNNVKLEEAEHKQKFVPTSLEKNDTSVKFVDQELIEEPHKVQFNDASLEAVLHNIEFKKVNLEGLDEYLAQLKTKLEELRNYKAIIEEDKENGNATKLKSIELLTNLIDANIEAEKQLQSAKLILTDMDNIENHSMQMQNAELEKPTPKQNKITSGGLIDDYEPNNDIQPIDDVLEFKERFRRGFVRNSEKN